MAHDRQQDDAKKPPHSNEADERRPPRDQDRSERDRKPRNGEVDEGLDETFPASDPPAPSRPTGAK